MSRSLQCQMKTYATAGLAIAALVGLQACDELTSLGGQPMDNTPPTTSIANVPPPNDADNLYSPLVEMSWTGQDPDGYISGFEVSWVTYHETQGDSVVHDPFVTADETMIIPFESSDVVNRQRILVRAIDNQGAIDPVGDTRTLYTRQGIPPETFLYYPKPGTKVFVAPESSPAWRGVGIYFTATDVDGWIRGYSLRVDDGEWSPWQTDTSFVITPDLLKRPLGGTHRVAIRSQDDTYIIEETPVEFDLELIEPTHHLDWLIVDATLDDNGGTERPTDEAVDEWYRHAMGEISYDTWDLVTDGPLTRELLGQYHHVLWHSDNWRESPLVEYRTILTDYVRTGGRLVLSGWDVLVRFNNNQAVADSAWIYGDFVREILHVSAHRTIQDAKMRAVATSDGDTLEVDLSKLFVFRDGLYRVTDISSPGPFAEPFLTYVAADEDSQHLDGLVVALSYQNPQYRVVFLGFPMSFLTPEAGRKLITEIRAFMDSSFYF